MKNGELGRVFEGKVGGGEAMGVGKREAGRGRRWSGNATKRKEGQEMV